MKKVIEIHIDKLYRYDRVKEPCFIGIPLKKGLLYNKDSVTLCDGERALPLQSKVTSFYEDGSVRFLFLRFLADIPANKNITLQCVLNGETEYKKTNFDPVEIKKEGKGYVIKSRDEKGECISYTLGDNIFENVRLGEKEYTSENFYGPLLTLEDEENCNTELGEWDLVEEGPLCVILKADGVHVTKKKPLKFRVRVTAWAKKPYLEVAYRIINNTDDPLWIKSLEYKIVKDRTKNTEVIFEKGEKNLDSTGCGDSVVKVDNVSGGVHKVGSSAQADTLSYEDTRTLVASSNYKTSYIVGTHGEHVNKLIDGNWLMKEANEHFGEVYYGTFFADHTDKTGGICASVYQAYQNFPKAVQAEENGINIMLVPQCEDKVVLQSGMSREQKFLLHFHRAEESISSLNDRSIVYQMPYRPYISPRAHKESGVWIDIFPKEIDVDVEENLTSRADGHCRAYGMLNFGDSYDSNYTAQGRGGGKLVWCNNEYDYPHACALQYVRTGIRRFLDYNIASCSHWMDVDVCHYHKDEMYVGGQWEHTAGHTVNGVMVCSHEWVEGLLDYYNLTGDERGLETALGIGKNVERLLDMPMYANPGEANARETGWALRTLTALYVQTGEKSWLKKTEKILNDFFVWEKQYGHWLAPYTDNTLIRVGFMISVAIGSLMRYYRFFPTEELKGLMLRAVDDMIENCYVEDWGLFYYKELPSLSRLGTNTLLLEALTVAYDLSGDKKYLEYGVKTFKNSVKDSPSYNSSKKKVEDAVLVGSMSSKNFAQSMIPLAIYYRAIKEAEIEI